MFGGTGLGLSISQRLIKAMGGSIEVHSTPQQGSVFSFSIQSKGPPEQVFVRSLPKTSHPLDHSAKAIPALAGRVLFADDALDNRRLVEHLIRQTGADVVLVENGHEAIEAATNTTFDLILMDVQMPIVDGLSATRSIRRAGITTPIVAVSAGAMISDVEKALDAGCSLHLGKPFERTALYEVLSRFVRPSPGLQSDGSIPIVSTLSADDPEMRVLLTEFINGLPGRYSELAAAWRNDDRQKVAALSHKLKGSAGMYGYPLLASEARKLEQAAKAGQSADIDSAIRTIGQIIEQIRKASAPAVTSSTSRTQEHDQKQPLESAQDQSRTRPH
jgi:CheY-like chemotaxis protein